MAVVELVNVWPDPLPTLDCLRGSLSGTQMASPLCNP